MSPDLYAGQDMATAAAVGVVGLSILAAMIRALLRAIGGRKPRA